MPDVTYNTGENSGGSSGLTTKTFQYTVSTNADRILLVGCMGNGGDNITGVTYHGDNMDLVTKRDASGRYIYLFYLLNPDVGGDWDITVSASSGSIWVQAIDYYNCKQQAPFAVNTGTTAGSTLTLGVTTSVDDCRLVGYGRSFNGPPGVGAGTGTTARTAAIMSSDPYLGFIESTAIVDTGTNNIVMTGSVLTMIACALENASSGATYEEGVGDAHGNSTVSGATRTVMAAAGVSHGLSTVTGFAAGLITLTTAGASHGVATVTGFTASAGSAYGQAHGLSTVTGVTASYATAFGIAHGVATVLGVTRYEGGEVGGGGGSLYPAWQSTVIGRG